MKEFINLDLSNIENEHICCAIADKKHHTGVNNKKEWLKSRIKEGHIFRKLNVNGKIFIEFAPLENAWVPISGDNYLYIYCLWVAGSYKDNGYGKSLIEYAINYAKEHNKNGICILSSLKKKPFISEKGFLEKYNFKVVDKINDYELMALSFSDKLPKFNDNAKKMLITSKVPTIYYTYECPYIENCIKEIEEYTSENKIKIDFVCVDTLEKAKNLPCVFNNWAFFNNGKFVTTTLLNKNSFIKLLESENK